MSVITDSLIYQTLTYWGNRLQGHKKRGTFLITKAFEITCFMLNKRKSKSVISRDHTIPNVSDFSNEIEGKIPKIGLVIPVYITRSDDIIKLEKLFESIRLQEYDNFVVVLVDDASPIEYSVPANYNFLKLTDNKGPATARNNGIRKSLELDCEIVAFTDSDCILDKKWLNQISYRFLTQNEAHLISGNTISYNKVWFGEYHDINGTLNGRKYHNSELLLYGTTCNLAISRNVAEEIKFDESFPDAACEDIEFCVRAIKSGFNVFNDSSLKVYHDYGYNGNKWHDMKVFWKQISRYAKSQKRLLNLIPEYYDFLKKTVEISNAHMDSFGGSYHTGNLHN